MFLCFSVSGEVYSWGYGVLGHGREVAFTKTPMKIQEFDNIDEFVIQVSCGPDCTAIITGRWPVHSLDSNRV